jgi:hypothetical protein
MGFISTLITSVQTLVGNLHITKANPRIRWDDTDDADSYFQIVTLSASQTSFNHVNSAVSGLGALLDFNPQPLDGTSNAAFRAFRDTNTTGDVVWDFHTGDGTVNIRHRLNCSGDTYLANTPATYTSYNVGVGITAPLAKLHSQSNVASVPAFIAQAYTGQTADIVEIRASGGGVLSSFDTAGDFSGKAGNTVAANITANTGASNYPVTVSGSGTAKTLLVDTARATIDQIDDICGTNSVPNADDRHTHNKVFQTVSAGTNVTITASGQVTATAWTTSYTETGSFASSQFTADENGRYEIYYSITARNQVATEGYVDFSARKNSAHIGGSIKSIGLTATQFSRDTGTASIVVDLVTNDVIDLYATLVTTTSIRFVAGYITFRVVRIGP